MLILNIDRVEPVFFEVFSPVPLVNMEDDVPVLPDGNPLYLRLEARPYSSFEHIAKFILPLIGNYQRYFPAGLLLEFGVDLLIDRSRARMADDQKMHLNLPRRFSTRDIPYRHSPSAR
jgi:hypothetical protein